MLMPISAAPGLELESTSPLAYATRSRMISSGVPKELPSVPGTPRASAGLAKREAHSQQLMKLGPVGLQCSRSGLEGGGCSAAVEFAGPRRRASHAEAPGRAQYKVTFAGAALDLRRAHITSLGGGSLSDEEEEGEAPSSSASSDTKEEVDYVGMRNVHSSTCGSDSTRWCEPLQNCTSKFHAHVLRDKVYVRRCLMRGLNVNSGIRSMLTNCPRVEGTCFCNLHVVSFRNFLLGDRGLDGVVPLLKFGRQLRYLSLAGNGMRGRSLSHLSTCLLEPTFLPHLSVLDLSHNPVVSSSVDELLRLLPQRQDLVLVGLTGTALPGAFRQQAMRLVLANFAVAEKADMLKAWEFARDGCRFADRELWVRCDRVLTDKHGPGIANEGAILIDDEFLSREASDINEEMPDDPYAVLDTPPPVAGEDGRTDAPAPSAGAVPHAGAGLPPVGSQDDLGTSDGAPQGRGGDAKPEGAADIVE